MRRPGFGCASLVLLLLLLPASACAANATVSFESPDVQYDGDVGVDHIAVSVDATPEWVFHSVAGGALLTAGATCTDVSGDESEVACQITPVARIDLDEGDDVILGGDDDHEMAVDAGPGDDELVICCAGDNTLEGGAGNDEFDVGVATGQNTIDGGAGDDVVLRPVGADEISGGGDTDTVVYQTKGSEDFTVTLDDMRNDGPSANQNVHTDVENLTGGPESDHFVGSNGPNVLRGGQGNDELKGGAGEDTLEGGEDEDSIFARDGEHDTIDCGFGEDSATVDTIDTVVKCERVSYPDLDFDGSGSNVDCDDHNSSVHPGAVEVPGDGVDQDCSGADAPPTLAAPVPAPSGTLSGGRAARVRRGSGSASFRCRAPAGDTCSVRGGLFTKGKRGKRIGSVSGRVAGGRTGPLALRLNGTGRGLLEDAGRLTAAIRATITNEAGATSPFNGTIQLKRAR